MQANDIDHDETDQEATARYQRAGRVIYGFQRLHVVLDDAQRAALTRYGPPALADRVARLAAEYDAIVKTGGDMSDARVDAAMTEAEQVSAELAAWRSQQAG